MQTLSMGQPIAPRRAPLLHGPPSGQACALMSHVGVRAATTPLAPAQLGATTSSTSESPGGQCSTAAGQLRWPDQWCSVLLLDAALLSEAVGKGLREEAWLAACGRGALPSNRVTCGLRSWAGSVAYLEPLAWLQHAAAVHVGGGSGFSALHETRVDVGLICRSRARDLATRWHCSRKKAAGQAVLLPQFAA